ncbi:MAG: 1-acyl-sn-glycerol-3-phosphate acyltransferase [Chloroflexi bacterium]|nr:1-acyl-sn-glycerol-3-phosphate acyltransferase [Chloroflexota bacterium]
MMRQRSGAPLVLAPPRPSSVGRPGWPYSPLSVVARGWIQAPLFGLLGLLVRTEVSGLERIEQMDRPVLFVANHISHLDTAVVLRALPAERRRRIAVGAARDYFYNHALVGAMVGLGVGAFPLTRGADIRPLLDQCTRLKESGWSMLFFPEGTRSTSGEIGPFRHGVGLIAATLGLPVVPIRTRGLFEVLPKGSVLLRPGRVTVNIGSPFDVEPGAPIHHVTASIKAALHAL